MENLLWNGIGTAGKVSFTTFDSAGIVGKEASMDPSMALTTRIIIVIVQIYVIIVGSRVKVGRHDNKKD